MSTKKSDKKATSKVENLENKATPSEASIKEAAEKELKELQDALEQNQDPTKEESEEKELPLEEEKAVSSKSATEIEAVIKLRALEKKLKEKDAIIKSLQTNSVPRDTYNRVVLELKQAKQDKRDALVLADKLSKKK